MQKCHARGVFLGRAHVINGNTDFDGVFAVPGASTRLPRLSEVFEDCANKLVNYEMQQTSIDEEIEALVDEHSTFTDDEMVPAREVAAGPK